MNTAARGTCKVEIRYRVPGLTGTYVSGPLGVVEARKRLNALAQEEGPSLPIPPFCSCEGNMRTMVASKEKNDFSQRRSIAFSMVPLIFVLLLGARDSDRRSLFYRSQAKADADLSQFDRENPKCELWTNWERMCSRLGSGGATTCVSDPTFKAKPSRPFCVADAHGYLVNRYRSANVAIRSSAGRFCAKRSSEARKGDKCVVYARQRPFNGTTLATRRAPACEVWSDETAPWKPVCSERGRFPELPLCRDLPQNRRLVKSRLYCATHSPDLSQYGCLFLDGTGVGPDYPKTGKYEITGPASRNFEPAVRGLFCGRRH